MVYVTKVKTEQNKDVSKATNEQTLFPTVVKWDDDDRRSLSLMIIRWRRQSCGARQIHCRVCQSGWPCFLWSWDTHTESTEKVAINIVWLNPRMWNMDEVWQVVTTTFGSSFKRNRERSSGAAKHGPYFRTSSTTRWNIHRTLSIYENHLDVMRLITYIADIALNRNARFLRIRRTPSVLVNDRRFPFLSRIVSHSSEPMNP